MDIPAEISTVNVSSMNCSENKVDIKTEHSQDNQNISANKHMKESPSFKENEVDIKTEHSKDNQNISAIVHMEESPSSKESQVVEPSSHLESFGEATIYNDKQPLSELKRQLESCVKDEYNHPKDPLKISKGSEEGLYENNVNLDFPGQISTEVTTVNYSEDEDIKIEYSKLSAEVNLSKINCSENEVDMKITKVEKVSSFKTENFDEPYSTEEDLNENYIDCEQSAEPKNERLEKLVIHKKTSESLRRLKIPITRLNAKIIEKIEKDGSIAIYSSLLRPLLSLEEKRKYPYPKEDLSRLAHIIREGEKFNKHDFRKIIRKRADVDEKGRPLKYKCPTCSYKSFSMNGLSKHHIGMHHRRMNLILRCTDCDFTTNQESALNRHMQRHKKEPDLRCPYCPYITRFDVGLRTHQRRWHLPEKEAKTLNCPECNFNSVCKTTYEAHRMVHLRGQNMNHKFAPKGSKSDLSILKCNYCKFHTPDKNMLRTHLRQTHKISNAFERAMYRCKICGFETKHSFSYRDHVLLHKTEKEVRLLECYDCGFKTKWKKYLTLHIRQKHRKGGIQLKEKSTYKCSECAKEYHIKGSLNYHMLSMHGDRKLLMCDQCNFTTKIMKVLKQHVQGKHINPKKKVYQCQKCSHITENKSIHKDHLRTHKYICYLCGMRYGDKGNLRQHIIGHMSEKEQEKVTEIYKCPCCEYKTRNMQHWKRHMKRLKHYAENDRSKGHLSTHKYICYSCEMSFSQKDYLRNHVISHMSKKEQEKVTKMHKCPRCEYKTRNSHSCKRHMMRFKHYAENN